jgi:mannosylglucosylglycerate synthase
MNIVLIHYAAPPVIGGVESVMARHARLMVQAGHRVCIIAGRGGMTDPRLRLSLVSEADSRHPEVLRLKAQLDAGRIPEDFEPFTERLVSLLRENMGAPDRVIAHNVCSLNKNLALTAALHRLSRDWVGPRLILWHHDLAWTTPRYQDELHAGYPWDLLRTDWPWAEQVVVSEQRQQELAKLLSVPMDRIHVIPNGVDTREFLKLEEETEALIRSLRLSEAAPLVLLPVRITPRKNIELGLRVLASLREQFEGARLLVTGPLGPHNPANRQYYERLLALRSELGLEQAAIFLAQVVDHTLPDAVIADLYKVSDLLFLPSREEGFGIPVLEAGLAGIPVFCSDISALRELGASQAYYFSPDDEPSAVSAKIVSVLRSDRSFGLRKRVLRDYTWDGIYQNQIAPLLAKGEA